VHLIGLDFGTTTSSAVAATACVRRNAVNARMELSDFKECFRSEMVFTPYQGDRLDLERLNGYLHDWLKQAGAPRDQLFGGGALLTGLTAEAENAEALVALIRRHLGDALIARANDPRLESWLAFMGSCAGVSLAHPRQRFLNLDIGGGTTNLALGQAGEVHATGCLFVGARHFQVVPGTYRLLRLSTYAQALLEHLGRARKQGDDLTRTDRALILDFYLDLLEAAVLGDRDRLGQPIAQMHVQAAMPSPMDSGTLAFTLSGGVGELVYRRMRGEPWPSTTAFGDLGIELAQRLVDAPFWADHWRRFQPAAGGRATVYGLLRHSTQVSGNTIFLRHPKDLPLRDLPILGTINDDSSLGEQVSLAKGSPRGAAFRLVLADTTPAAIRSFAIRLRESLQGQAFPSHQPLVLFVAENVGKALGQYVTAWGAVPLHLLVIDEVTCHNAQYATIGAPRDQVIPVTFYGLSAGVAEAPVAYAAGSPKKEG
jgi:ethanolamine utilization protein EutA